MKKKYLLMGATAAVAGLAVVGLASCGGKGGDQSTRTKYTRTGATGAKTTFEFTEAPQADTYATEGGRVDVLVNYAATGGISRAPGQGIAKDPLNPEVTYAEGAMLPTWTAFASYTRTTIVDASSYTQNSDNNVWTAVAASGDMVSQNDSTQKVDLIYNSTTNIRKDVAKLTALNDFIDVENPENAVMKNFSAWLKKNKSMQKTLAINGKYYYTPYFDGMNDIERMFIMDTSMTTKVLDSTEGWDTTTKNGKDADSNVVQAAAYTPFVDENYNYPADQEVDLLFDGQAIKATIKKTDNIIKQQNTLLAQGCTGKELAEQFKAYIKTAYAEFFDADIYTKESDLFISDSAAYNADELIALMRVVKANPGMITGDATVEIETFFPRAASNNRIENIFDFTQIWGVQGVDGEQNGFYFAGDGKIHSVESTQASYDALKLLSKIYDEGLILGDFYTNAAGKADSTGYLDKFYKKTVTGAGYGFMMYDYSAATIASNDVSNGIGTKTRTDAFADFSQTSITGILAPLTYWATESNWSHDQAVTDKTGKTLKRYYESNRALKTNTWAIPLGSDNAEGAARLMDFTFSELGGMIQDYGPTEYWATPNTSKGDTLAAGVTYEEGKAYVATDLVAGEKDPILSAKVKSSLEQSGKDFWTYMRNWMGSTHGIGHVRSKGVNLQATNAYGQWGVNNIQNAFGTLTKDGNGHILELAMIDKNASFTWDTSVPTGYVETYSDDAYDYGAVTGFWSDKKFGNNNGWVGVVTSKWDCADTELKVIDAQKADTTYAKVLEQREKFAKKALYTYAKSVGTQYVPSYATATN